MLSNLRAQVSSLLSTPQRLHQHKEWSKITHSSNQTVVLGFGGVLSGGRLIHGGAVKLLSLRNGLANDEQHFNCLYLVSSAQPDFAEDLLKICQKKGIRFIWNQNGVGYPAWAGPTAELHNAPMRRLRATADFVIYQSEFCRFSANQFLGSCDVPSKILLNPVDLARFCPTNLPKPQSPLRLLAMGTQNYAARVLCVIDALPELHRTGIEATLTIAGGLLWKNAEAQVAEHARRLGVEASVFRVGEFSQDMAVSLYRSHHLLVHPKYLDPCPTVVAEAMACGLPVVGSKSGGVPEMVPEDCGRLIQVPENDWSNLHTPDGKQISKAITDLLPEIECASRAARDHALTAFDSVKWVQDHQEICSEVTRN